MITEFAALWTKGPNILSIVALMAIGVVFTVIPRFINKLPEIITAVSDAKDRSAARKRTKGRSKP